MKHDGPVVAIKGLLGESFPCTLDRPILVPIQWLWLYEAAAGDDRFVYIFKSAAVVPIDNTLSDIFRSMKPSHGFVSRRHMVACRHEDNEHATHENEDSHSAASEDCDLNVPLDILISNYYIQLFDECFKFIQTFSHENSAWQLRIMAFVKQVRNGVLTCIEILRRIAEILVVEPVVDQKTVRQLLIAAQPVAFLVKLCSAEKCSLPPEVQRFRNALIALYDSDGQSFTNSDLPRSSPIGQDGSLGTPSPEYRWPDALELLSEIEMIRKCLGQRPTCTCDCKLRRCSTDPLRARGASIDIGTAISLHDVIQHVGDVATRLGRLASRSRPANVTLGEDSHSNSSVDLTRRQTVESPPSNEVAPPPVFAEQPTAPAVPDLSSDTVEGDTSHCDISRFFKTSALRSHDPSERSTRTKSEVIPFLESFNVGLSVYYHLGIHFEYLRLHLGTCNGKFGDPSPPLLETWSTFIAIMASSRHYCDMLIKKEEVRFLASNGDPSWLSDPTKAPDKLKRLQPLNRLMAHSPWRLTPELMRDLLNFARPWLITELCQAIMTLAHYHALSSFIWGLGLIGDLDLFTLTEVAEDESNLTEEPECFRTLYKPPGDVIRDYRDGESPVDRKPSDESPRMIGFCERILHLLNLYPPGGKWNDIHPELQKLLFTTHKIIDDGSSLKRIMADRPLIRAPISQRFRNVDSSFHSGKDEGNGQRSPTQSSDHLQRTVAGECESMHGAQRREDENVEYEDFDMRADILTSSGYWLPDSCFMVLDCYYGRVADRIRTECETLMSSTNCRIGSIDVPTTWPIREACWQYVQRLYGIETDNYSYNAMNNFLSLKLKVFLKKLVCFPERITSRDFQRLLETFSVADMLLLSSIAIQSRRIASLNFAFSALSKAML